MVNVQRTQTTRHAGKQAPPPPRLAPPLWHLIPRHEYQSPAEPTSETLRSNLRNLRNWVREATGQSTRAAQPEAAPQLRTAPPGLLTWVAPPPTWENAVDALDTALATWCNAEPQAAGIQPLVGAPYSDLATIATQWGQAHDFAIIKPPTPAQILDNDQDWMKQWQYNEAERLILPHLEQCYLRHHNGLDLIRRLLDWLWQAEVPCLLVADSWAWCYLQRVHHLDALCHPPLTLAPLDAYALDRWFFTLANRDRPDHFTFRQEKDGQRVLRYAASASATATETAPLESHVQEKPIEFLRYLAARSRGISGVAWAIWRYSLQIAADHDTEENVQEKASHDSGITVWVTAWEDLALPELPGGLSSEGAFVLHSLLLHNRVRTEILPRLLPCSAAATMQAVKHLQTAGIVEEKDQTWQVTPLAYATVRNYLRSEGYLIDDF